MDRLLTLKTTCVFILKLLLLTTTLDAHAQNTRGEKLMITNKNTTLEDETFDGTWPFRARYSDISGFRMHYIDEGTGPDTMLLLHGEPTWGYLFRHQISFWKERNRVVAVDHMGFGKSDVPDDRTYWLQDHINNIEKLVLKLDLRNITLVMHDFGGPVGMGLAIRHPERIKRIVSINGPTPLGQPDLMEKIIANASESPWFQWILKAENEGVLEQVLSQLDYNILSTLKLNGFERNEIISDTWLNAYRAAFIKPEHTLGAIGWAKGFALGKHEFEKPDSTTLKNLAKKPALAIWGEADRTLSSKYFIPLFQQAFPNGEVHRLRNVGHYSPEDAPEKISHLVTTFMRLEEHSN
ncbi:alpha/beta fold hydrolase [Aliamphritea ceti]|uniref:alpha/beta fold hydrolase n=1 Tax=Aliamphritea ceti TaxID=1524258 RepID=UPI0021C3AE08|nr:alpha/beta fold hydrolase [Aliamphritea ceti]